MKAYKNWSGKIRLQMYAKLKTQKKNNELPDWLVIDGNCSMCRKKLSDPRSMKVGYGEICADKWGFPWGAK